MKRSTFTLFILLLFVGFSQLFFFLRGHFSGLDELKIRYSRLAKSNEQEKLKVLLVQQEMATFQQQVALLLPQASDVKKSYPLRNLASVVTEGNADQINLETASSLFEEGRNAFKKKDFETSNGIFKKIVDSFPDSLHIIESYFLLVEGLYQVRNYEACTDTIEQMVALFPENELTGFSLLRLGAVYHSRDRLEDAADVYRMVGVNYKNPQLKKQAASLLREIEL